MNFKRMTFFSIFFFISGSVMAVNKYTGVEMIPFKKNTIVDVHASTFTVTEIVFANDENIKSIQNGDIAAWTVDVGKVLPNTLFIKPTVAGSNTNMTVITDQHTYYFHLRSQSFSSDTLGKPIYAIKFRYPKQVIRHRRRQLPVPKNWNYSFHGARQLKPLEVFDNGRFTYFKMPPHHPLPAIFSVETRKGDESVVNFRRKGPYLVVYRLSPQFTLRLGKDKVASVFNNSMIRSIR